MKALICAFTLFLASLSSGCFPQCYTARQGVAGVVVNADTGQPLDGAVVSMYLGELRGQPDVSDKLVYSSTPDACSQSRSDGRFVLPPERRWFFGPPMIRMALLSQNWRIVAGREGYLPTSVDIVLYDLFENDKPNEIGRIALSPARH